MILKYWVYSYTKNIITGENDYHLQAEFYDEKDAKEYINRKKNNKLGIKYLIDIREK